MRTSVRFLALLVFLGSCRQDVPPQLQARIDSLTTAAADRDRLIQEVSENTRLLSDISAELASVRVPATALRGSSESPLAASRDSMLRRVHYITSRVNELEPRLQASARRVRELTTLSDSLRATLESTLVNLQSVIESQRGEIAALTGRVDTLAMERTALQDTLTTVRTEQDRVYYVIGTKQELVDRGIVVEEGGARFLFVLWRQGRALAPARELDPAAFTEISQSGTTSIPLPDSALTYHIASRHSLEYVQPAAGEDGGIKGVTALTITQPSRFWANSKFLIIVVG